MSGLEEYVIFFSNSGSEANETAFKIARQYYAQKGEPHRYKFMSRYRGYHGNTMATMAATDKHSVDINMSHLLQDFYM